MYERDVMETSDIIQIVSVCFTVLGFVASEILALCPGFKANGLLHWLKMYYVQTRLRPSTPTPSVPVIAMDEYIRETDDTLGRNASPTPTRTMEHYFETPDETHVSGSY